MKVLLSGNFYKANLHTHTINSDGKLTPEEMKEAYKSRGYQIVAFTDHDIIKEQSHLNDENFLALTGNELGIPGLMRGELGGENLHISLIAKRPDMNWQPYKCYQNNPIRNAIFETVDCPQYPKDYDVQKINQVLREANERGFLAIYNHPNWSMQSGDMQYQLEGLWGVEARNSASVLLGYGDVDAYVYRAFLNRGRDLMPVMADDSHIMRDVGHSWMMIGAKELTYDAVIEAMEQRNVYSSCGPEIYDIRWEGTTLSVRCSGAEKIVVLTNSRMAKMVENAQEAEFNMVRWWNGSEGDHRAYIRVAVYGKDGGYALTRAYWRQELE